MTAVMDVQVSVPAPRDASHAATRDASADVLATIGELRAATEALSVRVDRLRVLRRRYLAEARSRRAAAGTAPGAKLSRPAGCDVSGGAR